MTDTFFVSSSLTHMAFPDIALFSSLLSSPSDLITAEEGGVEKEGKQQHKVVHTKRHRSAFRKRNTSGHKSSISIYH